MVTVMVMVRRRLESATYRNSAKRLHDALRTASLLLACSASAEQPTDEPSALSLPLPFPSYIYSDTRSAICIRLRNH